MIDECPVANMDYVWWITANEPTPHWPQLRMTRMNLWIATGVLSFSDICYMPEGDGFTLNMTVIHLLKQ